jgi:LysR family transcriptional regulator, hydrogen peroxide-inducible genes activator
MNLQQLKYIVAINRFRNFAKAADSCNISQPTLSAMLLKLEEELDVRIFDRTNKQVTPTSAGEKNDNGNKKRNSSRKETLWLT